MNQSTRPYSPNDRIESGLARVLRGDGARAGTAFLAADRLLITCAHVVVAAGAAPPGTVSIAFLADAPGVTRTCDIVDAAWRSPDLGDVAILRLRDAAPPGCVPLPLGTSFAQGANVVTVGFPDVGSVDRLNAAGTVRGMANDKTYPRIDFDAERITHGFSGAPLFDVGQGLVIGVVTSIIPQDAYGRHRDAGLAIPTREVLAVCAELRPGDVCPYRNLGAFGDDDADVFFGREAYTQELVSNMRDGAGAIALLGPSGSGKSSVLHAGLLHALRQGTLAGSESWSYLVVRPSRDPFAELIRSGVPEDALASGAAFMEWRARCNVHVCLCIDQFEEIFFAVSAAQRDRFFAFLDDLADAREGVSIVFAMRDDYYPALARHGTALLAKPGVRLVNVPSTLSVSQLEAIVREPARAKGLAVDDALVRMLVNDSIRAAPGGGGGAESTVLPLLESALTLVWHGRRGTLLTADAYPENGVAASVSVWATEAYNALSPADRERARRIILSLVDIATDERDQRARRRQRTKVDLLRDSFDSQRDERVLYELTSARLLITARDARTGEEIVEIIHDALLERWQLLRDWIRNDRAFLEWRTRTQQWAEQWRDAPADARKLRLLRESDLSEAQRWSAGRPLEMTPSIARYLAASKAEEQRARMRRGAAMAAAYTVLVAVALTTTIAYLQQVRASRFADLAASRSVESRAIELLSSRGDQAAVLAVEADVRENSKATNDLLALVERRHAQLITYLPGHASWLAFGSSDTIYGIDLRETAHEVAVEAGATHGPSFRAPPPVLTSWSISRRETHRRKLSVSAFVTGLAVNPSGSLIALRDLGNGGATVVIDAPTGRSARKFGTRLGGGGMDTMSWSAFAFRNDHTLLAFAPRPTSKEELPGAILMDVRSGTMQETSASPRAISVDGAGFLLKAASVYQEIPAVCAGPQSNCRLGVKEPQRISCSDERSGSSACPADAALFYSSLRKVIVAVPAAELQEDFSLLRYGLPAQSTVATTRTTAASSDVRQFRDTSYSWRTQYAMSRNGRAFARLNENELDIVPLIDSERYKDIVALAIPVENVPRDSVLYADQTKYTPPDVALALSPDASLVAVSTRSITAVYRTQAVPPGATPSRDAIYQRLCTSSGLDREAIRALAGEQAACLRYVK